MSTRVNVNPDELQLAASVLSLPNIFEIKYSAPVRLYRSKANTSNWTFANSYGIVTVTLVEKQSVVMIRLVDLKTKAVTMEQECYEGFEYQVLSSNFHAFESDDGFTGLLFAERFDADQFAKQVCQLIRLKATGSINGGTPPPSLSSTSKPTIQHVGHSHDSNESSPTGTGHGNAPPTPVKKTNPPPSTPPPVSTTPTVKTPTSIANTSSVTSNTSAKEPEKKHTSSNSGSGSSGGGLFSKIFGTKNKDQIPDRSQIKISGPKVDKFKHVSHIGFDPKQGFTDIPPELKTIFEKAGISEEQLKDKKTAKFLMKTLVTVTSDAPSMDVPPPPTNSGRPTPPPTPGNRPTPPPFKGSSSGNVPSGSSAIGAGGFVPPPPTNVPPPPVVDHSVKPRVSVASPATDSDGASGSGGFDMLSEIKNKKLKTVKQEDLPEFNKMAESDQNNLAAKIAGIMELRRGNIEYSSEDEDSEDDDWEL